MPPLMRASAMYCIGVKGAWGLNEKMPPECYPSNGSFFCRRLVLALAEDKWHLLKGLYRY